MMQFGRSGEIVACFVAVLISLPPFSAVFRCMLITAVLSGPLSVIGFTQEQVIGVRAAPAVPHRSQPSAIVPVDPKTALWFRLYIGTYTGGDSKGIYTAVYNAKTGEISTPELAAEISNPSFLAVHPTGKFLYSCSEVNNGSVVAFAADPEAGTLKELNQQSSAGAAPCHIVVDKTGRFALVANYAGGNVAVLPIDDDGKLKAACSVQQHTGSSVNKDRQEGPHAHSINLSPDNRFAVAADLGTDKLYVYKFDAETGELRLTGFESVSLPAGSGPRHFAFSPDGEDGYSINELRSTVSWFSIDRYAGRLELRNTMTSLLASEKRASFPAEIVVHPNGRFVYCSNRGPDTISVFKLDEHDPPSLVDNTPSGGKVPRNFIIDPAGKYLLAANQESGTINVFWINQESGKLKSIDVSVSVGSPVCLRLFPLEGNALIRPAGKATPAAAKQSAE